MTGTFIAKKLVLARESRGKSQVQLSGEAQLSQGQLSKFEGGFLLPAPEQQERIAKALKYPLAFFNTHDPFEDLAGGVTFYRRRQRVSMRNLREIQAWVAIIAIHIRRLLAAVDVQAENRFTKRRPQDVRGGVQEIARLVRAEWKLPAGPINDLSVTIESAGGIIVPCDFLGEHIDALYQDTPGLPPLFFINRNKPGDRVRYSLAHEVGHAIMHDNFNEDVEDEANGFASELLMPRADISMQLLNFNLAKAAQLKPFWKVSMAALIYKAHELKKISDRHYSTLFMQMSANGFRTREPAQLEVPLEVPSVLSELIRTHLGSLNYSPQDLCRLLTISEEDFFTRYMPNRNPMRIVNTNTTEDIF